MKEESPAQAKDISKSLGTWGPQSVLSHKGLPSFSPVDEELSGELWTAPHQHHSCGCCLASLAAMRLHPMLLL